MTAGAAQTELLAAAIPALLLLCLLWRREWQWIGLYIAVSFGLAAWVNCTSLLTNLWDPSAPQRAPLGSAIAGCVLYLGGMYGAMRPPRPFRTLFLALAAMEMLFVAVIPLYRWAFDLGEGAYFAINGHDVSNALGAAVNLLLAILPMVIGIPWLLARQSASERTIIASALSRYGQLSGIAMAAFMIVSTCFVAWGYVGRGPFAGEPNRPAFEIAHSMVGPNMIFGLLMGMIIYLFWSFPKRFFDPVVNLLEASQTLDSGPLEDIAHPLWRGMARTLDERRRQALASQQELNQVRSQLVGFFDNLPTAVYLKTVDHKLVYVSKHLAQQFGKRPEDIIGQHEYDLHATAMQPVLRRIDDQILATGEAFLGERVNLAFNRQELVSRFPIVNDRGDITHIGGMNFDIEDRVQAERALSEQQSRVHQSEKLAALGQLLAGVSHELNNPLAAVIGQTALLAEDLEGTEHAARISKIRRAADRCARIVQSFLAMARQKTPEYRSVEINDQVRAAAELTEYQMRAAGVKLQLRLAEGLPAIDADPDQLHQVLVNLLTNARQALEDCSGDRVITLTTVRRGKQIRLTVADNGKGIDPAVRKKIFDPYFTTKATGFGTGIGLSYSLGIIEAHGGTIAIEDAGVGTVFAITLPVKGGEIQPAAPDSAVPAKARGRALIIDDEEDVGETLADMLKRMDIDVTVAVGGVAGQAALARGERFDLILSDVRMPDIDGPALYAWAAAHRPELVRAFAFVTGDTLSGQAADFLQAAGCPVLEKPFTPAALRDLVAATLAPQMLQL